MNLIQFWPQFAVILIFLLFLIKDLVGYKRDNLRTSALIEIVRYGSELGIVIYTGFISWAFFKVLYVVDVSVSILLVTFLFIWWKQFLAMAATSKELKDASISKVRLIDFASITLLAIAGFFNELVNYIF